MGELDRVGRLVEVESPPEDVPASGAGRGRWITLSGLLLNPDTEIGEVDTAIRAEQDRIEWRSLDPFTGALVPAEPSDGERLQLAIRTRVRPDSTWRPLLRTLGVPLAAHEDARSETVVIAARAGPRTAPRTVLWCFGPVSRSIPPALVDPRFGLVAALNKHMEGDSPRPWRALPQRIRDRRPAGDPPDRVRAVSSDMTSGPRTRSQVRSGAPAAVGALRFDMTADHLRELTIRTGDPLMNEIDGGRAVRFTTYVDALDDFAELAEYLIELRGRSDYRAEWGWIDRVVPVPTREEQDRVLELLHHRVREGPTPVADVLLPDAFDDEAVDGSTHLLLPSERLISQRRPWLEWVDLEGWLRDRPVPQPGAKPALRRSIRVVADGVEIARIPMSDLLVAELADETRQYVVTDGDVLVVQRDFLDSVDDAIARIERSDHVFPMYWNGTEPQYLEDVSTPAGGDFAKLDGLNIVLPGETSFEACDLITAEPRLVFAKIKGRSAPFSHLCTQAEAAAEILKRSAAARDALVERVAEADAAPAIRSGVDRAVADLAAGRAENVVVTLLLLGRWRDDSLRSLPLVSRVRLRRAAERIAVLGYRFEVARP